MLPPIITVELNDFRIPFASVSIEIIGYYIVKIIMGMFTNRFPNEPSKQIQDALKDVVYICVTFTLLIGNPDPLLVLMNWIFLVYTRCLHGLVNYIVDDMERTLSADLYNSMHTHFLLFYIALSELYVMRKSYYIMYTFKVEDDLTLPLVVGIECALLLVEAVTALGKYVLISSFLNGFMIKRTMDLILANFKLFMRLCTLFIFIYFCSLLLHIGSQPVIMLTQCRSALLYFIGTYAELRYLQLRN